MEEVEALVDVISGMNNIKEPQMEFDSFDGDARVRTKGTG